MFARFIAETLREGPAPTLEELLVLHEVRAEGRVSAARASELFQSGRTESRNLLDRLVNEGFFQVRGAGKSRYYRFADDLRRRFGDSGTAAGELDRAERRRQVLAHVRETGSIVRAEAAELFGIDPARASRLLREMRDDGHLQMVGTRRAARYVLPG